MKKIEHYMHLPYKVEIATVGKEMGGGYIAMIPQLGSKAFQGYGETADEALENLETVKRHTFSKYISQGIPILEPEPESVKEYSGRFVVRMPGDLHRSLAKLAKGNNSTLNQYVTYLLTRRSVLESVEQEISGLKGTIWQLQANFSSMIVGRPSVQHAGFHRVDFKRAG